MGCGAHKFGSGVDVGGGYHNLQTSRINMASATHLHSLQAAQMPCLHLLYKHVQGLLVQLSLHIKVPFYQIAGGQCWCLILCQLSCCCNACCAGVEFVQRVPNCYVCTKAAAAKGHHHTCAYNMTAGTCTSICICSLQSGNCCCSWLAGCTGHVLPARALHRAGGTWQAAAIQHHDHSCAERVEHTAFKQQPRYQLEQQWQWQCCC